MRTAGLWGRPPWAPYWGERRRLSPVEIPPAYAQVPTDRVERSRGQVSIPVSRHYGSLVVGRINPDFV